MIITGKAVVNNLREMNKHFQELRNATNQSVPDLLRADYGTDTAFGRGITALQRVGAIGRDGAAGIYSIARVLTRMEVTYGGAPGTDRLLSMNEKNAQLGIKFMKKLLPVVDWVAPGKMATLRHYIPQEYRDAWNSQTLSWKGPLLSDFPGQEIHVLGPNLGRFHPDSWITAKLAQFWSNNPLIDTSTGVLSYMTPKILGAMNAVHNYLVEPTTSFTLRSRRPLIPTFTRIRFSVNSC